MLFFEDIFYEINKKFLIGFVHGLNILLLCFGLIIFDFIFNFIFHFIEEISKINLII